MKHGIDDRYQENSPLQLQRYSFFEYNGSHPTNNTPTFYPSLNMIVRWRKWQNAMAVNSKRKQETLLGPPVDDYHNSK